MPGMFFHVASIADSVMESGRRDEGGTESTDSTGAGRTDVGSRRTAEDVDATPSDDESSDGERSGGVRSDNSRSDDERSDAPERYPVRLDEHDDRPWRERVEELLYAGERVRERVEVDGYVLVVTSHRVLWFGPDEVDGPRFRQADRPNVATVRLQTVESLRLLGWSIALTAIGVALVIAAFTLNFEGTIPALNDGGPGLGAAEGTIEALESVLATFELVVLGIGASVILLALVVFAWYVRSRTSELVVAIIGRPDLSIPLPTDPERSRRSLETAIDGDVEMTSIEPDRNGRDGT